MSEKVAERQWIRLVCGDKNEVMLPKEYFPRMSLFKNPAIAKARRYELRCKASSGVANLLLARLYDENEEVVITQGNFQELQSLTKELGFSGLDKEARVWFGV